jgi:hypothetical protein
MVLTPRTRALLLAVLALAAFVPFFTPACAKPPEVSVLQATDLAVPDSGLPPFDRHNVIELDAFVDTSYDSRSYQAFLERTPYKRPSFLASYQSNGLRAADALYQAGLAHRINPLVLLVRAQVDQGLVGTQFYPFPPARVEYVFRCGCPSSTVCDPALAGFDRQVDCLARKLRQSLDEISASGATAGGWAVGTPQLTLDNVKVQPANEATAALYQYDPVVGIGKRGAWLFWNIWNQYFESLPLSTDSTGQAVRTIGDPCQSDRQCTPEGEAVCGDLPGGMCTVPCTDTCPAVEGRPEAFCAFFGADVGGYCLPTCNKGVPGSCRTGYECRPAHLPNDDKTVRDVCAASKE